MQVILYIPYICHQCIHSGHRVLLHKCYFCTLLNLSSQPNRLLLIFLGQLLQLLRFTLLPDLLFLNFLFLLRVVLQRLLVIGILSLFNVFWFRRLFLCIEEISLFQSWVFRLIWFFNLFTDILDSLKMLFKNLNLVSLLLYHFINVILTPIFKFHHCLILCGDTLKLGYLSFDFLKGTWIEIHYKSFDFQGLFFILLIKLCMSTIFSYFDKILIFLNLLL